MSRWTFSELDVPIVQDFRVLVLTSFTLRDKSASLLLLQGYVGLQKLGKSEGICMANAVWFGEQGICSLLRSLYRWWLSASVSYAYTCVYEKKREQNNILEEVHLLLIKRATPNIWRGSDWRFSKTRWKPFENKERSSEEQWVSWIWRLAVFLRVAADRKTPHKNLHWECSRLTLRFPASSALLVPLALPKTPLLCEKSCKPPWHRIWLCKPRFLVSI